MSEPLQYFRNSGDPIPASAGGPATPPPPPVSSAQAEIDRIFADPNRTLESTQRAVELLRTLGPKYRQVSDHFGPPSVGAAADPLSPVDGDGLTSGHPTPSPEAPADPLAAMTADAVVAAAPVLGERLGMEITPQYAQEIVASLAPSPDGYPRTLDDELRHWPEDAQARHDLEALHKLGWDTLKQTDAFPLSAEALDDKHGYRFHPKPFRFLVELGLRVLEQQEAEAVRLRQARPGNRK